MHDFRNFVSNQIRFMGISVDFTYFSAFHQIFINRVSIKSMWQHLIRVALYTWWLWWQNRHSFPFLPSIPPTQFWFNRRCVAGVFRPPVRVRPSRHFFRSLFALAVKIESARHHPLRHPPTSVRPTAVLHSS